MIIFADFPLHKTYRKKYSQLYQQMFILCNLVRKIS